ncbi:hypothetical protein CDIK_3858 [Cucumispora dikerogammari]|nr:hypothetical protein CDIK_3858 [Cucumispora dikerogammari]
MHMNKKNIFALIIIAAIIIVGFIFYVKNKSDSRDNHTETLPTSLSPENHLLVSESKQIDILRQLFKQEKTDTYDNYPFEYDSDFENFISKTIDQKNNDLKNFNDFKSFFISAVDAYRTQSKQERYTFSPIVYTIPEIEKIKYINKKNSELFDLLLFYKYNPGYFNFLIKQNDANFEELLEALIESTQETKKQLSKEKLDDIYKNLLKNDSYTELQYKFMNYYKICINKSNIETSFEQIKNKFIVTPLLEQLEETSEPGITVASRDTNSIEINLQNLLLGNMIDKMGIGYELTFPVFLNAPSFLSFEIILPGLKTFQQKIFLFSLEDGESEYCLSSFMMRDEKDKENKPRTFFNHKDEWWMLDVKDNKPIFVKAVGFNILANGDIQTEKQVLLFYSRAQ